MRRLPILWIGPRSMCSCSIFTLRVLLLVVRRIHGLELSLLVQALPRSSANLGIGAAVLLQLQIAVLLIVAQAVPGLIVLFSAQGWPLSPPGRQPSADHLPLRLPPQAASLSAVDPVCLCRFLISLTVSRCTHFTLSFL